MVATTSRFLPTPNPVPSRPKPGVHLFGEGVSLELFHQAKSDITNIIQAYMDPLIGSETLKVLESIIGLIVFGKSNMNCTFIPHHGSLSHASMMDHQKSRKTLKRSRKAANPRRKFCPPGKRKCIPPKGKNLSKAVPLKRRKRTRLSQQSSINSRMQLLRRSGIGALNIPFAMPTKFRREAWENRKLIKTPNWHIKESNDVRDVDSRYVNDNCNCMKEDISDAAFFIRHARGRHERAVYCTRVLNDTNKRNSKLNVYQCVKEEEIDFIPPQIPSELINRKLKFNYPLKKYAIRKAWSNPVDYIQCISVSSSSDRDSLERYEEDTKTPEAEKIIIKKEKIQKKYQTRRRRRITQQKLFI